MKKINKILISGIPLLLSLSFHNPLAASIKQQVSTDHNRKPDTSTTLPQKLPHDQYLAHIASELGWVPSDNRCGGYYVEPSILKKYSRIFRSQKDSTIISASGPTYFAAKGVSILSKNVIAAQPGRIVQADKAYIYRNKHGKITKIRLVGHVRLIEEGKLVISDSGSITLYPKSATLVNTAYHIFSNYIYSSSLKNNFNAWGTAHHSYRAPSTIVTLRHATYSTCSPLSPVWQISAQRIVLNKRQNTGRAYNAVLKIHNIPIFYTPYYSFPLSRKRKSGILTPILGHRRNSGFDFGIPYYLNLAPNYDLLLTPEYYTKRHFRGSALFRYLTGKSQGDIYASFLPNDPEFGIFRANAINTYSNNSLYPSSIYKPYLDDLRGESNFRGFLSATNNTVFNDEFSLRFYLNAVTDPYYFADVGRYLGSTTTNQLLNLFQLNYDGSHWQWSGYVQAYQTLHLITQIQQDSQALDQYRRLPDLHAVGYYDHVIPHTDFEIDGDFTSFNYDSSIAPDRPTGQRWHLRPGLSLPLTFHGGYIKPQVWLDSTIYQTHHLQPGLDANSHRNIPIIDIDSGLYLTRHIHLFGGGYTQTFEPRLFYLYVPFENQNNLPNYDSNILPFYYQQLFAFNQFSGFDRIMNANQTSLGLSSSLISDQTGQTIIRGDLGVTYYLTHQRVCLVAGCNLPQRDFSPIVADAYFYPDNIWSVNSTIAWDAESSELNNASVSLYYHRDTHHLFNLTYTFVSSNNNSIATSAVFNGNTANFTTNTSNLISGASWPLSKNWSVLGYVDYDISQERIDNYFAGLQYDSCCWAVRFIVKRTFVQSTINPNGNLSNSFDTSYFVELTLKGLGDFGDTNINSIIHQDIPGFNT